MNRLIVKDIVGSPYCGTYEDGVELYRVVYALLKDSRPVELDFEGIQLASSSFFNAAIGNLLQEFGDHSSQLPISYLNVTPRDRFIRDRTLEAVRLEVARLVDQGVAES